MEMIKFNYMLEIDILRNSSKKVGVLRGAFEELGCPKRHPDALLAKTMVRIVRVDKAEVLEVSTHKFDPLQPVGMELFYHLFYS